MVPAHFSRSVLFTALFLATLPAGAAPSAAAGTPNPVSDEAEIAAADSSQSLVEDQGQEGNEAPVAVRIADGLSRLGEVQEAGPFQFATVTLPTQSLTTVFNPASAHLNRSHVGATSRLVSAAWDSTEGAPWQPSVSYVLEQDRAAVVSGFGGADLLNTDTRTTLLAHNFAAEWNLAGWRLGYRIASSVERSAEANRLLPVSRSIGRGAYLGWQPAEGFELQADFGGDTVRDLQAAASTRWRSRSVSAQWQLNGGYTLSSSLYESRSGESETMPALRSRLAEVSLSHAIGGVGRGAEVQDARAYLRMEHQSLRGEGISLSDATPQNSWSLTVGLSTAF